MTTNNNAGCDWFTNPTGAPIRPASMLARIRQYRIDKANARALGMSVSEMLGK